jgi:ribose transport system substrate-binding protein
MRRAAAIAGLIAALAASTAQAAPLRFGLSSAGLSYPFAAAIAKGFRNAATKAGAKAMVLDGKGDVQKQANDVDDLIGLKIDGIAVMPLDAVVAQGWVDRATRAGVPIAAVGSQVGDPAKRKLSDVYPRLVTLVTQDEVAAGRAAGQATLRILPRGRVAKIAVIEGAAGFPEVVQRLSGFRAALDAAHASYRIVASQPGDWTPEKAETVCANILVAHPDIDLFFNEADDMAVGCAHAVRVVGARAKVVGIGGSKLAIAAIKAGRMDGTVCYKPEAIGALAFQALYANATGRKTRAAFVTYDTPGVTRANVSACVGQW